MEIVEIFVQVATSLYFDGDVA